MDQMRVTGQIEFLDDLELKKKLLVARPFLAKWGFTAQNPDLIVFRVAKCTAHLWKIDANLAPKEYVRFG